MEIIVEKAKRLLTVRGDTGETLLRFRVALGKVPEGAKKCVGDQKTPEGAYYICIKRETGKYGRALGISYPSYRDACAAVAEGRLDGALLPLFEQAERVKKRPPWGTSLGGEIYFHGGGTRDDWTAGCVALANEDMARLFALCEIGARVLILP